MERFWALNRYQKFILVILVLLALGFGVLYGITTARVGYEYEDSILVPTKEGGNTVYSGEIDGMPVSFTVTADNTVTYQYGLKTYGPYIVREDETAIPEGKRGTGVEVRCGEEIIFRGTFHTLTNYAYLSPESDAYAESSHTVVYDYGGVTYDENGNVIDTDKPSVTTIVEVALGPELTHKGIWFVWFIGLAMCVASAVSILFADELFRWNLAFRVRDAYDAEPSDWEISSRYIGWTLEPIFALIIFIMGLQ